MDIQDNLRALAVVREIIKKAKKLAEDNFNRPRKERDWRSDLYDVAAFVVGEEGETDDDKPGYVALDIDIWDHHSDSWAAYKWKDFFNSHLAPEGFELEKTGDGDGDGYGIDCYEIIKKQGEPK